METKTLTLDDKTYVFHPANALNSWQTLKNALALLGKTDLNIGKDEELSGQKLGAKMMAAVVSQLGDPALKTVEDLVLGHIATQDENGKQYFIKDQFNKHFGQYPHHLLMLLKEGLVYQFSPFLKTGGGLLSFMPQSIKIAQTQTP
ncbi:hypothetical protein FW755_11090 [Lonepinella koalarum]|uniref:Tail assembly chaperone n=1 Tax=Lonepinella koalarum TaxID=53417 RepID=A0A4R1KSR7_9PAST|nr:putative phage tail assembly chaperone [Lonepinella koalarum]MDH2927224.1 hypothetical protein [Lonepinella koalarum]TCK68106.1 tail assembly chaperone [Lonepinella koalarum]TFJ89493.1 hypothetical protein E0709_08960 [Lonepinella koalarum]TYG33471.1 hypothetical protein FW755_11090 [Lonepinella koalarum]